MFAQYAGAGTENVTARDLLIPRLSILQKLSPQLDKKNGKFIEDAEEGQICDIALGEIMETPLHFLPVYFVKQWLEWYPRKSGKGLAHIHHSGDILKKCTPDEKNRPTLANGNYVAETMQFFGINLSAGNRRSFIPMASTQLKKGRHWLTLQGQNEARRADGSLFKPPFFFRSYTLDVVEEDNNEGSWVGWKIEPAQLLTEMDNWEELFKDAAMFYEQLKEGMVRGDLSEDEHAVVDEDGAM